MSKQVVNFPHDLIKDIDCSKETWCIIVRMLRKWTVAKKSPPFDVWKVSMILSDEKGDRIKASVARKGHIQRYVKDLVDGGVYQFKNFEIVDNDDPCKIMFHAMIFFQEHDSPIPLYAFNFVPIKDIANNNAKNNELVDIIGFLQAFGNLVDHKNESRTTKKLALTIADQK
ncbi:uncharacterized protein LOC114713918 [Neltuma alba]|uniref:uncharacterized protein LOC114713918 n=1 Tax=Neltuma alba TaxID=207710 RepID=UPI0010A559A0|nr:uncharacterized protein LOC114713918 [Prosopis alba]